MKLYAPGYWSLYYPIMVLALVGAGCIFTTVEIPTPAADDARPPAGAPTGEELDYDSALAQLRAGPCSGLFWRTGLCDNLLFLEESTGHSSVTRLFDPQSRRLIARSMTNDSRTNPQGESPDSCDDRTVMETMLCEE